MFKEQIFSDEVKVAIEWMKKAIEALRWFDEQDEPVYLALVQVFFETELEGRGYEMQERRRRLFFEEMLSCLLYTSPSPRD